MLEGHVTWPECSYHHEIDVHIAAIVVPAEGLGPCGTAPCISVAVTPSGSRAGARKCID